MAIQRKENDIESSMRVLIGLEEKIHVLHIDDDSDFLKTAKQCLEMQRQFQIDTAVSVKEARAKLEKEKYDVIISDYQMPEEDGLEFFKSIRKEGNMTPFILLTGKGREEVAISALNLGVDQYLNKGGEPETVYTELAHHIKQLAETRKIEERRRESDARFRNLFENAYDGLILVDISGRILDINRKAAEIAEKNREDIIGKSFLELELVNPEALPLLVEKLRQGSMGRELELFELEVLSRKGAKKTVEIGSTFILSNNKPVGSLALVRDITQRKRAEQALKESEAKYRLLIEQSLNGILIAQGPTPHIAFVNKTTSDILGYTIEELSAFSPQQIEMMVPDEDREQFRRYLRERLEGKDLPPRYEVRAIRKDGNIIWIGVSSRLISYEGKAAVQIMFADITESKRAEETLRESEERFSRLAAAAFEGIGISEEGKIVDLNDQLAKMLGYERSELIGKAVLEMVAPESRDLVMANMRSENEGPYVHLTMRKDGSAFPVEIRARSIRYKGRSARVTAIRDINQSKTTEQTLAENQQKFSALFSGNPEATVVTGPDMHILDINPRFTTLFGYVLDEVRGRHLNDVVVPRHLIEEGIMLDKKAVDGYVYHDTVRMRKDGSLIPVSVSAAPISISNQLRGYIGVYKDISQQKNAEEKLAAMNEKLRVIGGLTRHDVRNKLSIIMGNTYINKKRLMDHPDAIESFRDIESACDLIVRIFDFAKDYERLGVEELTNVDVEDAVKKAASFFPDLQRINIINESHGLNVLADSLLRQLFYNLIDNSMKYGQKTTTVRIRYEESEGHLQLIYEDDGVGISQEVKSRIFSEGVTTGKGSGYGLYLIKKMMEVYGWTIEETGKPGKGARFVMTIPKTSRNGKANYVTES